MRKEESHRLTRPMQSRFIEGILSEVQQQLNDLQPERNLRLRVVVMAAPVPGCGSDQAPFRPPEFRNGVPLLPRRQVDRPIDLELVKRLQNEDDMERPPADSTAGC